MLLIRGNGAREGDEMGYATITKYDECEGVLQFEARYDAEPPSV